MGAVFALVDGTVEWSGGRSPVYRGEAWEASAALVQERPELFTAVPVV